MSEFELTITRRERPFKKDIDEELRWLLEVLGSGRFSEEYAHILREIVECMKQGKTLYITAYAQRTGRTRTTLSYHVQKLVSMGILKKTGRGYTLRAGNFERTIEEIKKDVERIFEDLLRVAKDLDALLGLPRG